MYSPLTTLYSHERLAQTALGGFGKKDWNWAFGGSGYPFCALLGQPVGYVI